MNISIKHWQKNCFTGYRIPTRSASLGVVLYPDLWSPVLPLNTVSDLLAPKCHCGMWWGRAGRAEGQLLVLVGGGKRQAATYRVQKGKARGGDRWWDPSKVPSNLKSTKLDFFLFLSNIYFRVSTLFHLFLFGKYVFRQLFYLSLLYYGFGFPKYFIFLLAFVIHHFFFKIFSYEESKLFKCLLLLRFNFPSWVSWNSAFCYFYLMVAFPISRNESSQ